MSTNHNDQSGFTQKKLFLNNGYRVAGPKNFMTKKTYNPYHILMMENKTYSFVVEWEMSPLGDYYTDQTEALNSEIS